MKWFPLTKLKKIIFSNQRKLPALTLVIICKNSEILLKKILNELKSKSYYQKDSTQIVVMDLHSYDGTLEVAKNLSTQFPNGIKILKKEPNYSISQSLHPYVSHQFTQILNLTAIKEEECYLSTNSLSNLIPEFLVEKNEVDPKHIVRNFELEKRHTYYFIKEHILEPLSNAYIKFNEDMEEMEKLEKIHASNETGSEEKNEEAKKVDEEETSDKTEKDEESTKKDEDKEEVEEKKEQEKKKTVKDKHINESTNICREVFPFKEIQERLNQVLEFFNPNAYTDAPLYTSVSSYGEVFAKRSQIDTTILEYGENRKLEHFVGITIMRIIAMLLFVMEHDLHPDKVQINLKWKSKNLYIHVKASQIPLNTVDMSNYNLQYVENLVSILLGKSKITYKEKGTINAVLIIPLTYIKDEE